ncbi:hypothetical protein V8E36_009397 [Tilletia maclaganii]
MNGRRADGIAEEWKESGKGRSARDTRTPSYIDARSSPYQVLQPVYDTPAPARPISGFNRLPVPSPCLSRPSSLIQTTSLASNSIKPAPFRGSHHATLPRPSSLDSRSPKCRRKAVFSLSGERKRKVRRAGCRRLVGLCEVIQGILAPKKGQRSSAYLSSSGNGEHACVQLIERRRFATTPFSKLGAISGRITETRERETNEGDRPKIGAYWLASPRGCTALSFQPTSITTGPFQTQR